MPSSAGFGAQAGREAAAGLVARMNPLKNRPSTSGAIVSTSKPWPERNSLASSTL